MDTPTTGWLRHSWNRPLSALFALVTMSTHPAHANPLADSPERWHIGPKGRGPADNFVARHSRALQGGICTLDIGSVGATHAACLRRESTPDPSLAMESDVRPVRVFHLLRSAWHGTWSSWPFCRLRSWLGQARGQCPHAEFSGFHGTGDIPWELWRPFAGDARQDVLP
jgi:hypothetical protein